MAYIDIDLYEFDDDEIVDHVLKHDSICEKVLDGLDMDFGVVIETLPDTLTKLKRDNIIAYENMLETLRYKELI